MDRPNIILITTDQQRGDCLSFNGHPEVRTPFLDSLAAGGVNFTRAYTTCPICIPARRTILSGMNPGNHGLIRNSEAAPFNPPVTLPRLLRDAGYQTQLIGKLHVAEPGVRHGYDNIIQSETPNDRRLTAAQRRNDYADWFEKQTDAPHTLHFGIMSNDRTARPWTLPEHLHHTNWVTNTAADFLCKYRDPSCPFFLHLSYWAPHQPALPPQVYWDRYKDTKFTPTIGQWVDQRPWRPGLSLDAQRGPFQLREMREHAAGYFGLINHVDDQLNYLFDRWSCSPLKPDRPTWIIFASDHGEQLGDHHLFRKTLPYEGSTHVPMFITLWRGKVDSPRSVPHLACLEDILPTCCELAGVPVPGHLGPEDGRSLVPVLNGKDNGREHVMGESVWHGSHFRYLVTADGFKYIRWTRTGEEQLFDLNNDPKETHDCSGEVDLSRFRVTVDAWRKTAVVREDAQDVALRPCSNQPPTPIWGK